MAPGYLLEFEPGVAQPQPGAAQDSAVPGPSGEAPAARPTSGPVQFFGFDNGYFHAVLFPALFIAWDPDLPLPAAFVVNEFYRYEGKKFSTSRRHAVWARDALHAGSDAVRLQVMRDRPNGRQTNFTGGDLERARDHLHKEWNGWLTRLLKSLDAETDGLAPPEQPGGEGWQVLNARMTRLAGELRDAYSLPGFDPRRAADLLDEVVRCARDFGYVHEYEPRPQVRRAALSAQLAVASALAAWAGPALPAGARRLSAVLGLPPGRPVDASALAPVPTGSRLRLPAGPIFAS
jgi:methionyl-tRNA synthetase